MIDWSHRNPLIVCFMEETVEKTSLSVCNKNNIMDQWRNVEIISLIMHITTDQMEHRRTEEEAKRYRKVVIDCASMMVHATRKYHCCSGMLTIEMQYLFIVL